MKNLLMIGQTYDCAGYGQAFRDYIVAASKNPAFNLSVKSLKFERWNTDNSAYSSIIDPLINAPIKADAHFIQATPENFATHKRSGVKNIGFAAWETSKIPNHWVPLCNNMDEIWTPSAWNAQVFKDSGVRSKIRVLPHVVDPAVFDTQHIDLDIPKDKFVFYSIFQWTERKNPRGLIKAFLSEFSKNDNVVLVLKTYRTNNSDADKKWIEQEIISIKNSMHIDNHAPVMVIHKMLSRQEIAALHKSCHCLVSPHKAEGWGMSMSEAMAAGTPVIATGWSGNLEFMDSTNSYLVNSTLTPVSDMPWKLYNGKMMWAEPDIGDLMSKMREVYSNYDQAKEKAKKALLDIDRFSYKSIGDTMISLLEENG